jgi:predicted DNA-binding ribbon-helix-helix protein
MAGVAMTMAAEVTVRNVPLADLGEAILIEETFLRHLKRIAAEQHKTLARLVLEISYCYPATPLASAMRLYVVSDLSRRLVRGGVKSRPDAFGKVKTGTEG